MTFAGPLLPSLPPPCADEKRKDRIGPAILVALCLLSAACSAPLAGHKGTGVRHLSAGGDAATSPGPVIAVLCYHDISDAADAPSSTISPALLRKQIRSLKRGGWVFLSLSELLAHRDRPEKLPPRTVVLTFDDGYRSFSEAVLPILREEKVKATLSVVTSFFDRPPKDLAPLMSWDQVREADRSGIVEIASHSHDLHRFVPSNPYRDTGPSVSTRRYILEEARYEDREEFRARIRDDLRTSRRILSEKLGHEVPVLAWPYGAHNGMARGVASAEGFTVSLGLESAAAGIEDLKEGHLPRVMVYRGSRIEGEETAWLSPPRFPVRAAQVDLDAVYDPDPDMFLLKVHLLVDRIRKIGATHVFLQACADPDGSGFFRHAWFMNHQLPVRADIWSMVAHKFRHAGLRVWIRAPSMNLTWEWERHPEWRIPFRKRKGGKAVTPWYFRLSPDLEGTRTAAVDFFTDIAVYLPIDGVLIDDDAYMLEGESLAGSPDSTPGEKSAAIRALIGQIREAVLAWRPEARFGRNIYAPAAEGEGVHPGVSQDFSRFLEEYDLTVVMAYARMEGHEKDAGEWAEALARRAIGAWTPPKGRESEAPPVMLKFQAYDWAREEWVPAEELEEMVAGARRAMAVDLGLYPVLPAGGNLPDGLLGEPFIPAASKRYPETK